MVDRKVVPFDEFYYQLKINVLISVTCCIQLIREGKTLYPFLSKLRGRRSVRFGIVKVYVEKECRKIKMYV
jgi:hypothetical protein